MTILLKKGTPVRTASVTGTVKGMKISDDGETLHYLVSYREHGLDGKPAGGLVERYFLPEEIVVDEVMLKASLAAQAAADAAAGIPDAARSEGAKT